MHWQDLLLASRGQKSWGPGVSSELYMKSCHKPTQAGLRTLNGSAAKSDSPSLGFHHHGCVLHLTCGSVYTYTNSPHSQLKILAIYYLQFTAFLIKVGTVKIIIMRMNTDVGILEK